MNIIEELWHRLQKMKDLERDVDEIKAFLFRRRSATLTIEGKMPVTLTVGQSATAKLHEFSGLNGTGTELPPVGPVSYTSSDPTIATVDLATGVITTVAPGTATISGSDAGNGLSATDTVSVQAAPPPKAQSATLVITPNQ